MRDSPSLTFSFSLLAFFLVIGCPLVASYGSFSNTSSLSLVQIFDFFNEVFTITTTLCSILQMGLCMITLLCSIFFTWVLLKLSDFFQNVVEVMHK